MSDRVRADRTELDEGGTWLTGGGQGWCRSRIWVGLKCDECRTEVGQKSDKSGTNVGQKSDECRKDVGQARTDVGQIRMDVG